MYDVWLHQMLWEFHIMSHLGELWQYLSAGKQCTQSRLMQYHCLPFSYNCIKIAASKRSKKGQKQTSQYFSRISEHIIQWGTFDKIWGVWIAEETLYQVFDMFSQLNRNYRIRFPCHNHCYGFLCIKPYEPLKYIWGTMLTHQTPWTCYFS